MGDVSVSDDASEWPFEAKAAAITETNTMDSVRRDVDDIVGIPDASWETHNKQSGSFTKYELALVLLALGGPQ